MFRYVFPARDKEQTDRVSEGHHSGGGKVSAVNGPGLLGAILLVVVYPASCLYISLFIDLPDNPEALKNCNRTEDSGGAI